MFPQMTESNHEELGFYLRQLLCSHGYFRSYLNKMGKALSADCLYFSGTEGNAEPSFFNCNILATRRASMVADMGMIAPDNIVGARLRKVDPCDTLRRGHLRMNKGDLERL